MRAQACPWLRLSVIPCVEKSDGERSASPSHPTRLLLPSHSRVYDGFVLSPFNYLSGGYLVSGEPFIFIPFSSAQRLLLIGGLPVFPFLCSPGFSSTFPGDGRLPGMSKDAIKLQGLRGREGRRGRN